MKYCPVDLFAAMESVESPTPQAVEMHDRPAPSEHLVIEPKPRVIGRSFTRENAREMQKRGMESRAARKEAERIRAIEEASSEAGYRQRQLIRVRAHIEMLNEKMCRAKEAKDLQFLATALSKLHDIEAKLRAPASADKSRGQGKIRSVEPLD